MSKQYLAMDPYTFDQLSEGWRELDRRGDYLEAAKLVDEYIAANKEQIMEQKRVSVQTMYFHAGQEYAMAGKPHYQQAVERFAQAHKGLPAWDTYVDGTIAFLNHNDEALEACTNMLLSLAQTDPEQVANAKLLQSFMKGRSKDLSYAQVYGAE